MSTMIKSVVDNKPTVMRFFAPFTYIYMRLGEYTRCPFSKGCSIDTVDTISN